MPYPYRFSASTVNNFEPQRVPAYSATEVFNYLRKDYPAYTYKEATLNPTNLRDRAVDWEADVVEDFPQSRRQEGIDWPAAESGRRIPVPGAPHCTAPECLTCHSVPAGAPLHARHLRP